jgi:hypothetical protein
MIKKILEIFLLLYITTVPIFLYCERNKTDLQWLYFFLESYNCLFQSIFLYNILDNIYPPILYPFDEYRISTGRQIFRVFIFVCLILFIAFPLFITLLFVFNFEYAIGNYLLLLLQPFHNQEVSAPSTISFI